MSTYSKLFRKFLRIMFLFQTIFLYDIDADSSMENVTTTYNIFHVSTQVGSVFIGIVIVLDLFFLITLGKKYLLHVDCLDNKLSM